MRLGGLGIVVFLLAALGSSGCATMFRGRSTNVRLESDPQGITGAVQSGSRTSTPTPITTPTDIEVKRSGLTEVSFAQIGYEEHHGLVRKSMNGWWLTWDILTCPALLCIPIIADGVSGAWYDVDKTYRAHLYPSPVSAPAQPSAPRVAAAPTSGSGSGPGSVSVSGSGAAYEPPMSDSERKAAARAAYQEGVDLQAQKNYPSALERLTVAQRLVDAPTNLLHIAQCYVALGKLVEAYETYETLNHKDTSASAPAPFREAIEAGRREVVALRPRIPSLRIDVEQGAQAQRLEVVINGRPMPIELVGIARPMNPGGYSIRATSTTQRYVPVDLVLAEGETRALTIKLGR